MSKPFILGQRVLYTLTEPDAQKIRDQRANLSGQIGNHVSQGYQFAADVVAVFSHDGQYANLQVRLDGNDDLWVTSVQRGDGPGTCQEVSF